MSPRFALLLAATLVASPALAAPPPPPAPPRPAATPVDPTLARCRAEIGWSRMSEAERAAPATEFRLALCAKRAKLR